MGWPAIRVAGEGGKGKEQRGKGGSGGEERVSLDH